MEIALHLGLHLTDRDHLIRCLMRNRGPLLAQGIAVPGPGRYRHQLRQLGFEMRERETNAQTQEVLLDGILDEDEVERVVLSSENFLAQQRWAVSEGRFYHAAGDRVQLLRHLFPEAEIEIYFAIRNPATFLPALLAEDKSGHVERQLQGLDPGQLRWLEMIARLSEAVPDLPITVWCDEDTPLIWPEVLRTVAGHSPDLVLAGWLAWYWDLVTPKAHDAMRRWFARNPPADDLTRRKMLSAMLARFARPEAVEAEALLPGWTEDTLDALSELYEQDVDLIATMPGVRLLEP